MTDAFGIRHFYLTEWREFRGISIPELSLKSGFSTKIIEEIELGTGLYNEHHLRSFSDALGCHPCSLLQMPPSSDQIKFLAQALRDITNEAVISYEEMGRINELRQWRESDELWKEIAVHLAITMSILPDSSPKTSADFLEK